MSANSFGELFKVTTFGESHGPALGVVVEGCPAGVKFDFDLLKLQLKRRRPGVWEEAGAAIGVSKRQEPDEAEVLSGVFEGITLGTPIAMIVKNQDARSATYQLPSHSIRPGHATDLWASKFKHTDPRGSGRASGRETVTRVMAGAVAKMFLMAEIPDYSVKGWAQKVGPYQLSLEEERMAPLVEIDNYPLRFPSDRLKHTISSEVSNLEVQGDSWGGIVTVLVDGLPAGLGEPVFRKIKSQLGQAVLSIGATQGFSVSESRLWGVDLVGSSFHNASNSNSKYGGIRGGLSTGEPIQLSVLMKPTSSIGQAAKEGRHDPCIIPRAIPVIEAMVSLVVADCALARRLNNM